MLLFQTIELNQHDIWNVQTMDPFNPYPFNRFVQVSVITNMSVQATYRRWSMIAPRMISESSTRGVRSFVSET